MHEEPDTTVEGFDSPETISLALAVEDISVARRKVTGDVVRLATSTRVKEHLVDEALMHEQVIVERFAVGKVVDVVPDIRVEGDLTIVPVVREEVVIERRLVLIEEVHMRRVQVSGRHRETVALREQVAEVIRIRPGLSTTTDGEVAEVEATTNLQPGAAPMTDETIVAVYDTASHAEAAVTALKSAGVPEDAISSHAATQSTSGAVTTSVAPVREKGFWSNMFGGEPDHDTAVYDRSLEGGSTVVTVNAQEAHVDTVMDILESHHPVDIDERAAGHGLTKTTTTREPITAPMLAGTAGTPVNDGGTMELSEESLAVGKRVVNRGGTRIRRFVVETPVEQNVTLHDETVTFERHPVTDGRSVTDSFSDKTIEMTESAEEAVVSKTARVYEEVGLKKTATDRVETIRDTLRKEEVEVEKVPGTTSTTATTVEGLNSRSPKI